MADHNDSQKVIQCPSCKASITLDELGEHVNANPQTKKEAIEEQIQHWGEAFDRNYLMQNVVFCPNWYLILGMVLLNKSIMSTYWKLECVLL
jgi:hypothetical protein